MSDVYHVIDRAQTVLRSPVAITMILTVAGIGALTSIMAGVTPGSTSLSGAIAHKAAGQAVVGPGDRRMAYWSKRHLADADADGTSEQIRRTFTYEDGSEIQLLTAYNGPSRWIRVSDTAKHEVAALRLDPQGKPILFQVTRLAADMKTVQSRLTAGYLDKRAFSLDALPPVSMEIDAVSEEGEMTPEQKSVFADVLDDLAFFAGPNAPQFGG